MGQRIWNSSQITKLVEAAKRNPTEAVSYYVGDAEAVYYATNKYKLDEKIGMVIGSIQPWVEAYCLANGAKKIITLDYMKIVTNHAQIEFQHALDYAKNYQKHLNELDFIATFSSLEHAGLGRYGDPYDPIDHNVQKVYCWLKPGGLFFLGFPVRKDLLLFNLHRHYGQLRLPLMFSGFKLLDVFYGKSKDPIKFSIKDFDYNGVYGNKQYVFVLQKQ